MTVRYVPPDGQGVEERSLGPGEVLSIGRSPGNDGITLLEADDTISRTAIELELESGGVRVTNTSTNLHVELGPKGLAGLSMRKKESHIINGDGWVAIRDDHLIEFKVLGPLEGRKSPLGQGRKQIQVSTRNAGRSCMRTTSRSVSAWWSRGSSRT